MLACGIFVTKKKKNTFKTFEAVPVGVRLVYEWV